MDRITLNSLFVACLAARIFVAFLALVVPSYLLIFLSVFYAGTASGLWYNVGLSVTRWRRKTGAFGGTVWWDRVRVVHAVLWTIAAVLAANGFRLAAPVLFADAAVGLFAYLWNLCSLVEPHV
jgi:hypothetical protein